MSWLGLAAGALLLCLTPLYLIECFRGGARPHPLSWGIWSSLGVLGFAATLACGAGPTVVVLGVTAALQVTVFIVAMTGGRTTVSWREAWPLLPALAGSLVWLLAGSATAAALGVVVADSCGLWPTLEKTWTDPYSEPVLLWAGGAGAFALGCTSVATVSLGALAYPVYLAVTNASVAAVAWGRRRSIASTVPEAI